MNLLDVIEMLCDWLAATHRHAYGDIRKSIEINQKRFKYSDELKLILINTLPLIEGRNHWKTMVLSEPPGLYALRGEIVK